MIYWIMGTILAFGYILLYYFLGALFEKRYQSHSVSVMCFMGFLTYYALFQIVALPMKIMKLPLSYLTICWSAILVALILFVILRRRNHLVGNLYAIFKEKENWCLLFFMIIFAVGIAIWLGLNTNTISDYDACYYIGLPVSSVYSNTLELMSPYTGEMLEEAEHFYIMNTDTLHSAIIYQVLNIHPLIERKWSFTIAMALIFEMAIYKCGEILFEDEKKKIVLFCVMANLILVFSYSIAGVSHYFAYRTYEGKAISSFQYAVLIFVFALAIYKKKHAQWPWAGLFFSAASGVAFCNTAIFMVPVMIGCTVLPYVISEGIIKKQWEIIKRYFIVLFPGIVWLILYMIL